MSRENLIGLSRARRPHNAIFVNFDDDDIPTKPLEPAVQTWKKVCTNPVDKKVEEELRKVQAKSREWTGPRATPVDNVGETSQAAFSDCFVPGKLPSTRIDFVYLGLTLFTGFHNACDGE